MKNIFTTVVILILACGSAFAASILNSKHDLSYTSTNGGIRSTNQSQLCIFCHTPHGMMLTLWNRNPPPATSISNYLLYTSSDTLSTAARSAVIDTQSASVLCMSCHDGTLTEIGTRTINTYPAGTIINMIDPNNRWGTSGVLWDGRSLANHPVGFDYAAAQAQKPTRLHTIAEVNAALGSTGIFFRSTATSPNYTSMECSSCHTVHDPANTPFLRKNNSGNAFCLACHIMY
jgi:predicted CXXCH cytochrome family protein